MSSSKKVDTRVMTPITWKHLYGSAWFETTALIFAISQRNAKRAPAVMSQTPSSNVIMVVLDRKP